MIDEAQDPLRILAGNSFRLALRAFGVAAAGLIPPTDVVFGLSHRLAEQIAAGEAADLFLATDLATAQSVAPAGTTATAFASDSLVAVARPDIGLTEGRFLDRLLSERVRIGIEVPRSHSGADLAWRMFERADRLVPGAGAILSAKARVMLAEDLGQAPISPGAGIPMWSPRRVMELIGTGEVDVVLGTNSFLRTLSRVADVVSPPAELAVALTSGLVVLARTKHRQAEVAAYTTPLLSQSGQAILARHGFDAPQDV